MALTAIYLPCTHYSTSSSICTLCVHATEPLSGKHTCRKVQCLPGIPHQELCRTLHREAKQEEYLKNIAEIKEILKGNTQEIERMLFQQMQELAAEMKFEEARR